MLNHLINQFKSQPVAQPEPAPEPPPAATPEPAPGTPFAIGEEFASKWQFLPYIERDIHQFNRLDVCNVGGLTEAMKVAGWSEAHYVDMMPHNPLGPVCTAATIHFAAAVPNFCCTWSCEFFRITGCSLTLPGL